jgi:hypothetical protein
MTITLCAPTTPTKRQQGCADRNGTLPGVVAPGTMRKLWPKACNASITRL